MSTLLSRMKAKIKKRPEHSDIKYLQFTFLRTYANRDHYGENGSDDDDTSSILTVSTNATMDNIPGTGRTIDTYVYQFFGRKLERFIFRGSMATLSPDRILQYLWGGDAVVYPPSLIPLSDVIYDFPKDKVSGLKGLVKQTQSDSLYRSAAALSALIRLTTSWGLYGEFYVAVAAVEPIFHLESLANALDDSNPEKKYFLLLVGLARAHLHSIHENTEITEELAFSYRQKLLETLDLSWQFETFANACTLLARVASSLGNLDYIRHLLSSAVHSYLETTYFLVIFLFHFLIVQLSNQITHPLETLFISTITRWLESILRHLVRLNNKPQLVSLLPICALHSVYLIISNMQLGFSTGLAYVPTNTPIILRSYLTICTARNRRLLASLDELRREVGDSMALKYGSLSNPLVDLPFIHETEDELQRSLDRAQSISVVENDLTREFLEARKPPPWDPSSLWKWEGYKERHRQRHRMGEFCRSNLDWEWDTGSCLKRLFRIDRSKNCPNTECAKQQQGTGVSATIDVPVAGVGTDGRALNMAIPGKGRNLLEKIRVRYETETGEVRYKTFLAVPSVEDISSCSIPDTEPGPFESVHETGQFIGKFDDYRDVVEAGGCIEETSDSEILDGGEEEMRSFRTNASEEDVTFIQMLNRPQYESRVEEWLDTQVDSVE